VEAFTIVQDNPLGLVFGQPKPIVVLFIWWEEPILEEFLTPTLDWSVPLQVQKKGLVKRPPKFFNGILNIGTKDEKGGPIGWIGAIERAKTASMEMASNIASLPTVWNRPGKTVGCLG
jgi:hypothetical protein